MYSSEIAMCKTLKTTLKRRCLLGEQLLELLRDVAALGVELPAVRPMLAPAPRNNPTTAVTWSQLLSCGASVGTAERDTFSLVRALLIHAKPV